MIWNTASQERRKLVRTALADNVKRDYGDICMLGKPHCSRSSVSQPVQATDSATYLVKLAEAQN